MGAQCSNSFLLAPARMLPTLTLPAPVPVILAFTQRLKKHNGGTEESLPTLLKPGDRTKVPAAE